MRSSRNCELRILRLVESLPRSFCFARLVQAVNVFTTRLWFVLFRFISPVELTTSIKIVISVLKPFAQPSFSDNRRNNESLA